MFLKDLYRLWKVVITKVPAAVINKDATFK